MDKKDRFNGVCDFIASHWSPEMYRRISDLSWIPEEKIATRRLGKKIAVEYADAADALDVMWHEEMTVFIKALKRWAEACLAVIEFIEIHSDSAVVK